MTKTKAKTRATGAPSAADAPLAKKPPRDPATLVLALGPGETPSQQLGRVSADPAMVNMLAAQAYQHQLMGENASFMATLDAVNGMIHRVKAGDLSDMEGMLVAQSVALQNVSASLLRRAQGQSQQRNLEAFINLALKAQAQSRATISALVDLKFPRQVAYVKQANIANGPQQVNNGVPPAGQQVAHVAPGESAPNELLGVEHGQVIGVDAGTPGAAARGDSALEAVGAIHRPEQRSRKAARRA